MQLMWVPVIQQLNYSVKKDHDTNSNYITYLKLHSNLGEMFACLNIFIFNLNHKLCFRLWVLVIFWNISSMYL